MDWRVARSLEVLRGQLNAMAPNRSKISDGSIGDAAHATRDSDHNPWYGPGIVTARDFTHDPAGGLDCNWLATALLASGDRRIKYIIWNRRIWTPGVGWRNYTGVNPHDHHLHLSVVASPACDETQPWNLGSNEENEMDKAQNDALAQSWGVLVSGANWNGSNLQRQLGYVVAQVQQIGVAVAAAASNGQLDVDMLASRLEAAAADAARDAVASSVLPALREILTDALGNDNIAQADAIVDRLAARLQPTA